MEIRDLALKQVSMIPRGKVATYKGIAVSLGNPKLARAVGNALGRNPDTEKVPCYRVVKSDGSIGGYSGRHPSKEKRLKADGIEIVNGKIMNLDRYLYRPPML